jgi:DNA polymerase
MTGNESRQPEELIPSRPTLKALREVVQLCQGCDLYRHATQAVFGEGPAKARVLFIGEQPGNEEDRQGAPFVGPAGRILEKALLDAGIPRDKVYVTNAVKHFKFEERGKRRIHKKPDARQVDACRPWLEEEARIVKPEIIVCLGATAAQELLGRNFRLTRHRGSFFKHDWAPLLTATVHPSSILRAPDEEQRLAAYQEFVADLKAVKAALSVKPPLTAL